MTGHGIGSHLARIFRTVFPFIKSGAKSVGKELLKTGSRIIQDVTENNVSIGDSVRNQSREAMKRIINGKGYKRKVSVGPDHLPVKRIKSYNTGTHKVARKKKKANKKRERDIFDL
jgi:hypothetical protein